MPLQLLLVVLCWLVGSLCPFTSSQEFYVTPSVPNPDCPKDKPCHTLDEYARNSESYFRNESKVWLKFLTGMFLVHSLDSADLVIRDKIEVRMTPVGSYVASIAVGTTQAHYIVFENISQLYLTSLSFGWNLVTEYQSFIHLSDIGYFSGHGISATLGKLLLTGVQSIELLESDIHTCLVQIYINGNFKTQGVIPADSIPEATAASEPAQLLNITQSVISDLSVNVYKSFVTIVLSNTIIQPGARTVHENGPIILVSNSSVQLNISGCRISYYTSKGLSMHLNYSDLVAIVKNTTFSDNMNGFYIDAILTSKILIRFENCTIESNREVTLFIQAKRSLSGVEIINCLFQHNAKVISISFLNAIDKLTTSSVDLINTTVINNHVTTQDDPTVELTGFIIVNMTSCQFIGNTGTPLRLNYGTLHVSGNSIFANNLGFQGGALSLVYSQLQLKNNSTTTFQNNHAIDVGGAIYVQLYNQPVLPAQCFYQVPIADDIHTQEISLIFLNNKADRGGDNIYGAALHDTCIINEHSDRKSVDLFEQYFHFEQSESNLNLSLLSSDPKRVCLCNDNGEPMCASIDYIYSKIEAVYSGEKFNVSAVVVGDEFGTVSSTVFASFLPTSTVRLGPLQDSQAVDYQQCKNLTYSVHSRHSFANIAMVLKVNQAATNSKGDENEIRYEIAEFLTTRMIQPHLLTTPIFLTFSLLDCPLGFNLSSDPPTCDCNTFLKENNILNCSVQNHKRDIYRSGTQWIGKLPQKNQSLIFITQYCPFDYCKLENMAVNLADPDTQCKYGRSGVLCGACGANLSQVLGGTACQYCTNNSLALLIAFALAGLLLVCTIKLLDLTIAVGTINGLIFYANVVWANQNFILSTDKLPTFIGQFFKIFLAWLNLDLGINTCFFVGMTAYWKTWLQFVFPIYIWTIAGLIILVSHLSINASKIFGNNSVQLLATLFILSFSKLLRVIIKAVSFTYLLYSDSYLAVWTEDGNIEYLNPAHAVLFAVALICLVFVWAPFMLTLLLIQPLRQKNHLWPLRWINTWKPLFDASTGPLKDKYHYWVGVLLMARAIILVTNAITTAVAPRVNFVVIVLTVSVLSLHTNMYKKWYLSLLEKSFLLNISVLAIAFLYIDYVQDAASKTTVFSISVTIALVQFVGIVVAHVVRQIKRWRQRRGHNQGGREIPAVTAEDDGEGYREPLLESDRSH